MSGVDLKLPIDFGRTSFTDSLKGSANVRRANSPLTTVRLPSQKTIRQMRSTVSGQPSNKDFFLSRSISLYGLCSDNLSPESSRYRKLSSSNAAEALSLRDTRECFTQHLGKCQRTSRLENLCRLCKSFDRQSSNTLCQRRLRHSTEPRGLCSGFNNHRFMSFTISMGNISQTQSCGQGTHAYGLKRLYTHVYPHYRRKSPRCQYSREFYTRTRLNLYIGSGLYWFSPPSYSNTIFGIFCHSDKNQFPISQTLFSIILFDHRLSPLFGFITTNIGRFSMVLLST